MKMILYGCKDKRFEERTGGLADEWMDAWMNGWKETCMDK